MNLKEEIEKRLSHFTGIKMTADQVKNMVFDVIDMCQSVKTANKDKKKALRDCEKKKIMKLEKKITDHLVKYHGSWIKEGEKLECTIKAIIDKHKAEKKAIKSPMDIAMKAILEATKAVDASVKLASALQRSKAREKAIKNCIDAIDKITAQNEEKLFEKSMFNYGGCGDINKKSEAEKLGSMVCGEKDTK